MHLPSVIPSRRRTGRDLASVVRRALKNRSRATLGRSLAALCRLGMTSQERTNFHLTKTMKPNRVTKYLSAAAFCLTTALAAQAKVNVVATLPDYASLAREIGGDNVVVTTLAKPTEDPHFVDARPSFVVKLREADMLIDGGAELEIGWLPPLLQNARNPKIAAGQPGRVEASQGIRLMEVPAELSRAAGDVHAMGNPHFMVDPIIAKAVAQHIVHGDMRAAGQFHHRLR